MKLRLTTLTLVLSCLCAFGQKTVQTNGNQYIFDTKTFQNVAGNGPGLSNVFGLYNSNGLYAAIGDMNSRFFVNGQANLPASSFDAFPQVFTSPNGYLSFCVFHAASSHGPTNASLMLSISSDGALTWSDPFTIITNANYDSRNFSAGMDRQGGIHVLYTTALITSSNYIWSAPHHYYSTNLGISGTDTVLSTNGFDYPPSGTTQYISFHGEITDNNGLLISGGGNGGTPGTRSFVYLSGNLGASWTNYNVSSTAANGYDELSVTPIGTTILLGIGRQVTSGATAGTLPFYWTTNSGTNWSAVNNGITGTTNAVGYPAAATTFSASGQKYIAVTYGNRENSNVWVSTIAADELYTNSAGGIVTQLLTNRIPIAAFNPTSGKSEGGYTSIAALMNGRLLVAYYDYTNSTTAAVKFITLSPYLDVNASRLRMNVGYGNELPVVITLQGTNLFRLKPFNIGGNYWSIVADDATANHVARYSYATGKGGVFGPESLSSASGSLINFSATNYPAFGYPGGIAMTTGPGGTFRIGNNVTGDQMLFYPTNTAVTKPFQHVNTAPIAWPPNYFSLHAATTNEAWIAVSNSVPWSIWFGTFNGNSNLIYLGHFP